MKKKIESRVELLSLMAYTKQPIADIHYLKSNQDSEIPLELYPSGNASEAELDMVH